MNVLAHEPEVHNICNLSVASGIWIGTISRNLYGIQLDLGSDDSRLADTRNIYRCFRHDCETALAQRRDSANGISGFGVSPVNDRVFATPGNGGIPSSGGGDCACHPSRFRSFCIS